MAEARIIVLVVDRSGDVGLEDQELREPGRMLAGWGPWVLFERDELLWREDLRDRSRARLGTMDRPIASAVALAGTPNAVHVSLEPEPALRRV